MAQGEHSCDLFPTGEAVEVWSDRSDRALNSRDDVAGDAPLVHEKRFRAGRTSCYGNRGGRPSALYRWRYRDGGAPSGSGANTTRSREKNDAADQK